MLDGAAPIGGSRRISEARILNYETPEAARRSVISAKLALQPTRPVRSGQFVRAPSPLREQARAVIAAVRAEGRGILTEPAAKTVLSSYGIPVVETFTAAATPQEAADIMRCAQ